MVHASITVVKFMKRKNLGNYEHEEISVEAVVREGMCPEKALEEVKIFVHQGLHPELPPVISEEIKKETTKTVAEKKAPKAALKVVEEPAKEVETPKAVETPKVEEVKKEAPKPAEKVEKGIVLYDFSSKEHRSRFATFLGENYPNWKKAKAGVDQATYEASIKVFSNGLNGKPFEDAKGTMLESFKAEIKAFFA